MIGCGIASASAPAGKWQAISQQPAAELGNKRSGPVEALASSTSQASGAGKSIELNHVDDIDRASQSVLAGAAEPGVWARVAPACNRGQAINVVGPTFRMACALLSVG